MSPIAQCAVRSPVRVHRVSAAAAGLTWWGAGVIACHYPNPRSPCPPRPRPYTRRSEVCLFRRATGVGQTRVGWRVEPGQRTCYDITRSVNTYDAPATRSNPWMKEYSASRLARIPHLQGQLPVAALDPGHRVHDLDWVPNSGHCILRGLARSVRALAGAHWTRQSTRSVAVGLVARLVKLWPVVPRESGRS